ncbi:hypothetical protein QRD40_22395 [Comamonas sp. Y6]|uniref:Lipoprotein n=1 Tax=Comamonas resistens TaxID=3046670 RepID=A0ABY8SNE9_9BURK|nr:hypothetical protein [Comamonas resistens]MDL5039090.1 hypothetical protein [Comamonas resistens]WHS63761.1 hypothetical protein QMY55_14605 [Comamonas resistens]
MMKKTFISSVCAAVAMLAGCGNKTPACADAETVSLVKQIYQQQFDKQHHDMSEERQQRVQFTVKDTTVALENITTDANNASTGKAVCSAQLTTVFPEDAVKAEPQMEQYMRAIYEKQGAVLDGTKLRGQVTYTVQRTEDTGALQVALNGFMPFMGYFHDIAMDRYDRMLRAQAAAKKVTDAQAPVAPSASQAEMEAESEGSPSAPAPAAIPTRVIQSPAQQPQAAVNKQSPTAPHTSTQTVAVPNLCSADETPMFACSTGKKRASLCMSGSGNELAYRLAPLNEAPEMVYPANAAAASTLFKQGVYTGTDGQSMPFVSFDKGNYRYTLYGSTSTAQGISVEQNGKRIADLRCQTDRLSEVGMPKLQSLNLGQDTRPLQLP